jgi:hypothetical protein
MSSESLPYELTDEECDNLVEIETGAVTLTAIDGPSKQQLALDAANPGGANLGEYWLTFTVEQSFQNRLERPLIIEAVTTTLSEPDSETSYEASYDFQAPIELAAHETRQVSFDVKVPADELSGAYVSGLVGGAVLGMNIAPELLIRVPDSDDCGYPDGMLVRGKEGTAEVQRPVESSPAVAAVLGAILKAFGHA